MIPFWVLASFGDSSLLALQMLLLRVFFFLLGLFVDDDDGNYRVGREFLEEIEGFEISAGDKFEF